MKLKVYNLLLLFFAVQWSTAQYSLKGTVYDENNNPLEGVEVFLKVKNELAYTDVNGEFGFENITAQKSDLIAFYYNYRVLETSIEAPFSESIELQLNPITQKLSEVVLIQEREKTFGMQRLRRIEGTALYSGKKSELVLINNLAVNKAANNARQIYAQVVGLNIFDNGDAGLQLNVGGRGLDPNRTAHFNTRQNGYDISADPLGYPESYYTPPAEALSQIQVVRGAASLQYGPQFGGLINFVFNPPNKEKNLELISRQTAGSNQLKTSFNSVSGTINNFSYYSFFNYKEGDGFRPNSRFNSRNFFGQFNFKLSQKSSLTLESTYFNYLAQQGGGLTDSQFLIDPYFSNRTRNWFNVDWKLYALTFKHRFSSKLDYSLLLNNLNARRSALGFRTNRVSQTDDLTAPRELLKDNFRNWGLEQRFLIRYKLFQKNSVALLGSKLYQASNIQEQGPGSASSEADFSFKSNDFPNYERQAQFKFPNLNIAFFGENTIDLNPKWSVTPGFRYEYIKTQSDGFYKNIINDLAGNTLLNEEVEDKRTLQRDFVLLGIGSTIKINPKTELYANFSENYRSTTFNDIRVVNPSYQIDPEIRDENGYTADIGLRGTFKNILKFDLSAFGLNYNDRIGEILKNETRQNALGEIVETGRVIRFRGNIGKAFIYGLESSFDLNLKSLFVITNQNIKLNHFVNFAYTQSEYLDSQENNVVGNKVEFIPEINLKTGLNFGFNNFLGSIQFTYLSEQFTDATNAPLNPNDNQRGIEGSIPAYDILDLSLSYSFSPFKIEAGVNNLLNTTYFARRATGYPGPGIIPAAPRTIYTTLEIKL